MTRSTVHSLNCSTNSSYTEFHCGVMSGVRALGSVPQTAEICHGVHR